MTEIENTHESIFLFVFGNEHGGYAKIVESFRRKEPGSMKVALSEIATGKIEDAWDVLPAAEGVSGIDIALPAALSSLVFVGIVGEGHHKELSEGRNTVGILHDATTFFGDDVVSELALKGKPSNPIIKNAKRHQLPGSKYPTLCSFEVDIEKVMGELGSESPISRFPIVFDFIDSDDGISPVFKKAHGHKHSSADKADSANFGHGGIHPPSGASMIVLQ